MNESRKPRRAAGRALIFVAALAFLATAAPCLAEGPTSPQGAAAEGGDDAPAAKPVYAVGSRADWKARVLRLEISLDLAAAGLRLPEGRLYAERMVERDFAGLAKDAVFALQVDSYRTIADTVADGSFEADRLVALSELSRLESSSLSKDARRLVEVYELDLDELSSLFLTGARSSPVRAPLEERPTRDYTGVVIYAKGLLPVHGEAIQGKATPCLFPRVYDSDMRLVLDKSVVVPEVLAEKGSAGGVLGYASGLGVEAGSRVGGDPLRVMALELFGDRRTDYVISREDALRILSRAGNRELLRQGKVVVVLDF
jgi:hypothetical protein